MQILIVLLSILTIILTVTIFITIEFDYDIFNNIGKIKITLFKFLVIFNANIAVVGEYLNLNKKKKVIKIKIDLKDKQIQFFKDIDKYLKNKIYFSNINVFGLICFSNPMVTSLISGVVNIIASIYFAKLCATKKDVSVNKKIVSGFRQNEVKFKVIISFAICLYDYLWAILKAVKAQRRREYEKAHKVEQNKSVN